MSLINEYRATEEAIKELQERLEKMNGNEALAKEIEFEEKLRGLMGEYGKSLRDIIAILDPDYRKQDNRKQTPVQTKVRAPREVKRYVNPHSGAVVETKGGNHKTLKEWKQEHGAQEVESWLEKN